MKKIVLITALFSSLMTSLPVFAQVSKGGLPRSFTSTHLKSSSAVIPEISFIGVDERALIQEDEKNAQLDVPYRFGIPRYVNHSLINSGKWDVLPNGDRIWRFTIRSQGAYSINLIFDK